MVSKVAAATVAAFAAFASLVGLAGPAGAAGSPEVVSGTFGGPPPVDELVRVAGGNVFIHEVATLIYAGGVTGSSIDDEVFVAHADGSFEGAGRETCTGCTIGGRTGDFVAEFMFHGVGDAYRGSLHFISASGGLSGLHGGGNFAGTISQGGGTYSYQYVFAP